MADDGLWNLLGAGVQTIGDFFTGQTEADIARRNLKQQEKNLDWQKEMQQESWRRDDTAVQRRMKDLEAAGINPLLAAGSAAGNAPVVHTEAPQLSERAAMGNMGHVMSRGAQNAINALSMSKDFAIKDAQAQLLQAQAGNVAAETRLKESQNVGEVMRNDVFRLENAFDLDTANQLKRGLIKYNEDVFRTVDNLTNKVVAQQARAAGERARALAMEQLVSAGLDKSVAEALSAGYAADIAKSEVEISGATVPARIAGAYTDVAGKIVGGATNLSLNRWLQNWLNSQKLEK